MQTRHFFHFIYRKIVLGLALAFVVLLALIFVAPGIFQPAQSPIEIRQAPATATSPYSQGPYTYADAVAAAAPAIVNIYTSKVVTQRIPFFDDPLMQRFFGNVVVPRKRLERSLGSGVIVSGDGYLLSNYHVVEGADEILVALQDGRTTTARIIGSDPETDLAILKTEMSELPAIILGHSENLRVGDVVLAVGNPFGVGQTVTMGIISATGRTDLGINTFENFIQTDAAINPGNSGGGLINARGELIGINTAIFTRSGGSQGIGFAIPISLARKVMEEILKYGHAIRGWLGIETQDITPQLAESFNLAGLQGVLVTRVYRNGPAHAAGVAPGDVITRIDDVEIVDSRQAMDYVTQMTPEAEIRLRILRNGKHHDLGAKIIQRPRMEQR